MALDQMRGQGSGPRAAGAGNTRTVGEEEADDYWKKCLLSLIFVSPAQTTGKTAIWKLHARGVKDMYAAFQRE